MPRIGPTGQALAEVTGRPGCVLEGGTIDAFGEQIVAGSDHDGDVLVICGTTLIVWAVIPEAGRKFRVTTRSRTPRPASSSIGGPSNAGGLFLDWVDRICAIRWPGCRRRLGRIGRRSRPRADLGAVPARRTGAVPGFQPAGAQLADLDLTHDAASVRRAAFEAAGFVTRRMLDASPATARRIVATGGGTRVEAWMQALADCTALPVHVGAVPEGGALGAAFLARIAAGLEPSMHEAARWARTSHIVDPDPAWADGGRRPLRPLLRSRRLMR